MNPIANCCLWYCSGLMIAGIVVFILLILLQSSGNKYLVSPHEKDEVGGRISALMIAGLINLVCLGLCCFKIIKGDSKDLQVVEDKFAIHPDEKEMKKK